MPIYSIMNTETEEVFEVNIKFADLDAYLAEHTNCKQVFTKFPSMGDPARLGLRKPDDGFRDVLRSVKSHHKRDNINTW